MGKRSIWVGGPSAVRAYCCCHPEDEMYCKELIEHLAGLVRQGLLEVWDLRKMLPGEAQENEINLHLSSTDIVLLLTSRFFFASDIHWNIMKKSMELHNAGIVHVVPVRARPYDYESTPLAGLQILPRKKSLSRMSNRDEGYVEIAGGIRQVMSEIRNLGVDEAAYTADQRKSEGLSLEQTLAVSISDPSLFIERGDILFERRSYNESLAAYEDALRLDPNSRAAYEGKAQALEKLASLAYEKLNELTILPSKRMEPQDDTQEGLK